MCVYAYNKQNTIRQKNRQRILHGRVSNLNRTYSPASKATRLVRSRGGGGLSDTVFVTDPKLLYWIYKYTHLVLYVLYVLYIIFHSTLWQSLIQAYREFCGGGRDSAYNSMRIVLLCVIILRKRCTGIISLYKQTVVFAIPL